MAKSFAAHLAADPLADSLPVATGLATLELSDGSLSPLALAAVKLQRNGSVVDNPAVKRMRTLGGEFTLSETRQVLETTRRVAVPLLEYLDGHKFMHRLDGALRCLR
ncbi:MAG: SelB C-terminal domain-containing protein [Corynebacterium sp.]|nr:SelB C-terminal domain-containing protein [Corynebacterium sp.]